MFLDRRQAGRLLAEALRHLRVSNPVVVGLPRGGVPVAAGVAEGLSAPLDVIVVRKLGVPGHREYAMGAVGEKGARYVDWGVVSSAGVSGAQLARTVECERAEVESRTLRFRGGRPPIDISDKSVVIVDDGVATGSTMTAAIRVARDMGAGKVIVAVPVAPADTIDRLSRLADEVVVLETPGSFLAVGQWYVDFTQVSDDEVVEILDAAVTQRGAA